MSLNFYNFESVLLLFLTVNAYRPKSSSPRHSTWPTIRPIAKLLVYLLPKDDLGSMLFFLLAKLPVWPLITKMTIWLFATKWPYLRNGRSDRRAYFTSGVLCRFGCISRLAGLIVFEICASKDTQLVEKLLPINRRFFCEDAFSRYPLTRLTWHSNAVPIEAPLIPIKMNVSVTCLMAIWGELGAFLQTYRKFMRQKVWFSK
jgi:hypothetical protein